MNASAASTATATPTPIPASAPVDRPPPDPGDAVLDPVLVAGEDTGGDGLVLVVLVEEDVLVVDARCNKGADFGVKKSRSLDACRKQMAQWSACVSNV